jgi:hypothetical protein
VIALTAAGFALLARTDPVNAERTRTGAGRVSVAEQLAPLKNIQIWRFATYYFFVFGGFIALARYLPNYYSGAYGVELTTADVFAGLYTLPGSVFRALGGWMWDRCCARAVMYFTFLVSLARTGPGCKILQEEVGVAPPRCRRAGNLHSATPQRQAKGRNSAGAPAGRCSASAGANMSPSIGGSPATRPECVESSSRATSRPWPSKPTRWAGRSSHRPGLRRMGPRRRRCDGPRRRRFRPAATA